MSPCVSEIGILLGSIVGIATTLFTDNAESYLTSSESRHPLLLREHLPELLLRASFVVPRVHKMSASRRCQDTVVAVRSVLRSALSSSSIQRRLPSPTNERLTGLFPWAQATKKVFELDEGKAPGRHQRATNCQRGSRPQPGEAYPPGARVNLTETACSSSLSWALLGVLERLFRGCRFPRHGSIALTFPCWVECIDIDYRRSTPPLVNRTRKARENPPLCRFCRCPPRPVPRAVACSRNTSIERWQL